MLKKYFNYFLAVFAGFLLFLAFAPINLYPLAIVANAILFYLWNLPKANSSNNAISWRYGWFFGCGFFAFGASWIYISLHVYGFMPTWLAMIVTGFFVGFLALFPALQGFIYSKILHNVVMRFKKIKPNHGLIINTCLIFPLIYVFVEWLRSWLFTGFPWLFLGYSQIDSSLRGYAPLGSVYLVSYMVAVSSGLLYYISYNQYKKNILRFIFAIISFIMIWFSGEILSSISWTQPVDTKPITVSLIQGNIAQENKWSPSSLNDILNQNLRDIKNNTKSNLIVLSEAGIPTFAEIIPNFMRTIQNMASKNNTAILTGIPIRTLYAKTNTLDANIHEFNYYNGLMLIDKQSSQQYFKRHLVPFGEYTPLPWLYQYLTRYVDIPMSNFKAGNITQQALTLKINSKTLHIAPFICYEITYLNLMLDFLPQSNILLTISDDSWFGHSVASKQHLEIARMRSLESGRYQIIATNTGITAIIDNQGRIMQKLPEFTHAVLQGDIYAMQGSTPLVKFTHLFDRKNLQ